MNPGVSRNSLREILKLAGATTLAGLLPRQPDARACGRIVVIGGGFAGATCARIPRRLATEWQITLFERCARFVTGPFSNSVIGGLQNLEFITFGSGNLLKNRVEVVEQEAVAVDPGASTVRLAGDGVVP